MMIDNSEKHSTKEYRCEEFYHLGLNDNQIENVEEVISNYHLDYGISSSLKKIRDKNERMRQAGKYMDELISHISTIKILYPKDYDEMLNRVLIGISSFFLELDMAEGNENYRNIIGTRKIECPCPLSYLGIMKKSFLNCSSGGTLRAYKTYETPEGNKAIKCELSPNKKVKKGVCSQNNSLHYKTLHDLTIFWLIDFKGRLIKSDDSSFIKFLSIVFYGDISKTESMRKYYQSNYNVEIEIYPIDSN